MWDVSDASYTFLKKYNSTLTYTLWLFKFFFAEFYCCEIAALFVFVMSLIQSLFASLFKFFMCYIFIAFRTSK